MLIQVQISRPIWLGLFLRSPNARNNKTCIGKDLEYITWVLICLKHLRISFQVVFIIGVFGFITIDIEVDEFVLYFLCFTSKTILGSDNLSNESRQVFFSKRIPLAFRHAYLI